MAVLAAEEAKWAERMSRTTNKRTLAVQRVRHKAFQVAQTRIATALHKHERGKARGGRSVSTMLKRLGL